MDNSSSQTKRLLPPGFFPYMLPEAEQSHITEEYVSSPPALRILDETGAVWTLGHHFREHSRGEFSFDVLRNGLPTGEFACRIERRNRRIRIFGPDGPKQWNGRTFI